MRISVKTGHLTITNKKVTIKANTFCVHSDTDNAVLLVKELMKYFFLTYITIYYTDIIIVL